MPRHAPVALLLAGCALLLSLAPTARARPEGGAPQLYAGDEAATRDLFDSVRRIIVEGDASLGLPVLDPFELAFLNGSLASADGAYTVEGEVRDLVVTGLADFEASLGGGLSGLTGLKVRAAVSVPRLRAASAYGFDGVLKVNGQDVELYGDGPVQIVFEEVNVNLELVISIITQKIRQLSTTIDIGNIKVDVDGLLEGGLVNQFLSSVVSELANELFAEQKEALEQAVSDALLDPIQSALDDFSLDDLLCLLGLCSDASALEAVAASLKSANA